MADERLRRSAGDSAGVAYSGACKSRLRKPLRRKNASRQFLHAAAVVQSVRRKLDDSHVRAGLLFLVERCPNQASFRGLLKRAAAVKIESAVDGGIWSVSARGEGPALEVRRNLQTREVLSRRAGGKEVESGVLTVNGEDLEALKW